jgi:hypothetical protein
MGAMGCDGRDDTIHGIYEESIQSMFARKCHLMSPPLRDTRQERSRKAYSIAMKRPSPFVLIAVLLIAALIVVDNFLVKCIFFGALLIVGYTVVRRLPARAFRAVGRNRIAVVLGALIGILAIVAFCVMAGTQPRVQTTYRPNQFSKTNDIVDQRGFYQTETDAAQNQYVWTQERATIVFDFLVHKPITLTVSMRSAAVAGGPDIPVQVIVNGHEVGMLHPDPANPSFQPLSLRFVPYDWGGERTEIKLIPTTFKPKGDTRILGTMVQSITIDKSDAWSTIGRRMWLLWALPVFALAMLGLTWIARRFQSSAAGYGAIGTSLLGCGCAVGIGILILRIGFIERDTYHAWIVGSAYLILCFAGVAILLPFGAPEAASLFSRGRLLIARYQIPTYIKTRTAAFTRPTAFEPAPTRSAIRRDLVLVFVIALGVRLIWVTIMPPWQAPDEPDHFTYVAHIAEQAEIPRPPYPPYPYYSEEFTRSAGLTLFGELSAATSGTQAPALPHLPVSYDYASARSYTGSHQDRLTSAGARATAYPPLYYLLTALPYKLFQHAPILARLFAVRCGSAILGALTCVFGYLMAYELRRERRWGWALALSLAFLPMFVFITATVNNDVAMDLGATVLIWLLVRLYRQETISLPIAAVVGLVSGLTLLAKPGPLPVVVVVGIFMLVRLFPLLTRPLHYSRQRLAALGGYIAGGLIGYGPWVLFRYAYYGDLSPGLGSVTSIFRTLIGMTHAAAASGATVPLAKFTYPLSGYLQHERHLPLEYFRWLFVKSMWGNFGWLDVPLPDSAFAAITVICGIGIVGIIVQLTLQSRRRPILLILLAFVVAQVGFLFLFVDYYESYRTSGATLGLQGRYFFPVLAPALFLLLSGWDHLFRERPVALRLAPFVMVGLQLIGLATILAHYYDVVIGWS